MGQYRSPRAGGKVNRPPLVFRLSLYVGGVLILLAMLLAAVAIVPSADRPVHAAAAPTAVQAQPRSMKPCKLPMLVIRDRLAQLGGNLADWSLTDEATSWYGAEIPTGTYTSRVEISVGVPCWVLPSTINHEWMHQQQMLWFGNGPMHRRDDVEIMADCGSWLLGSDYTPYLDRARRTGAGCSPTVFRYAEAMIAHAGVPLVRHP